MSGYSEIDEYVNSQEYIDNEILFKLSILAEDLVEEVELAKKPRKVKKKEKRVRTYKIWDAKFNDDTCDFCKALHGKKARYHNTFKHLGYEFSSPPCHKGCNCTMHKVKE